MQFELKGAQKKYRRMRTLRMIAFNLVAVAAILAPGVLNFGRTDSLLCWVGGLVVALLGHLELRLKTIQIRLAAMDDRLVALTGEDEPSNLVLELNDW